MEPIEFRDIQYILAVEREGSFSRAAEKEFISQPALSRIVKRVEKELELVIFDRGSIPLKVTPEGSGVLDCFREMLKAQEHLQEYCDSIRNRNRQEITIGAASYFCSYVLPPVISAFRQEHPDCHIRIIETNDQELKELLRTGFADVGISVGFQIMPELKSFELAREMIVLAVPADNPINEKLKDCRLTAAQMKESIYKDEDCPRVSLSHFRDESFILMKEGNDMYERGLKMCRDAGFTPKVAMFLDQMLSAYYLAAASQGVAFTRASIPYYVEGLNQVYFYKIDHPDTERSINVFTGAKPASARPQPLEIFLEFLGDQKLFL